VVKAAKMGYLKVGSMDLPTVASMGEEMEYQLAASSVLKWADYLVALLVKC